jgi:hypothetical protein
MSGIDQSGEPPLVFGLDWSGRALKHAKGVSMELTVGECPHALFAQELQGANRSRLFAEASELTSEAL